MTNSIIYFAVATFVRLVQCLPVRVVAWLGRRGGDAAWWLDGRHRRVAIHNLMQCFGEEKGAAAVKALARENFRRLGENYACAVKTAGLDDAALARHARWTGKEFFEPHAAGAEGATGPRPNCVIAIGHFGNFELYARTRSVFPWLKLATTYRGLGQPGLDRVVLKLRERSGCRFFERRSEGAALKTAMAEGGMVLGLLCDQHAGDRGLRLPFFGRECSTSTAPAVFALRYRCPLHTGVCFRTGLGRWQVDFGEEIPTVVDGQPRSVAEIMTDVNRVFEAAIRRDPANWFWVHRRWKPAPPRPRLEPSAGEVLAPGGPVVP